MSPRPTLHDLVYPVDDRDDRAAALLAPSREAL
jgi:hypothetical protein